jgi:hypothetical protein
MSENINLYSKEGLEFIKIKDNNYKLSFSMENNKIILSKIIDFNLIKLVYDLNVDIYENVDIKIINENEAVLNLLIKNLFEEIGLPQHFSYVHIKKQISENKISFTSQTIKGDRPDGIPKDAKLFPIKIMLCECLVINPHKVNFFFNIIFDDDTNIPEIAEKIIGIIIFKIFKRLKQFIDNTII